MIQENREKREKRKRIKKKKNKKEKERNTSASGLASHMVKANPTFS